MSKQDVGNAMKNKNSSRIRIGVAMLFMIIGQTLSISAANANPPVSQVETAGGSVEADAGRERKHIAMVDTQGVNTVLDIPLRLGGFVTTVIGTGLFIGTSPITGLMTAVYPHDAIEKAADFLVVRPGRYTFVRPSGDFNYDSRSADEK
jgi:hypothetical protein